MQRNLISAALLASISAWGCKPKAPSTSGVAAVTGTNERGQTVALTLTPAYQGKKGNGLALYLVECNAGRGKNLKADIALDAASWANIIENPHIVGAYLEMDNGVMLSFPSVNQRLQLNNCKIQKTSTGKDVAVPMSRLNNVLASAKELPASKPSGDEKALKNKFYALQATFLALRGPYSPNKGMLTAAVAAAFEANGAGIDQLPEAKKAAAELAQFDAALNPCVNGGAGSDGYLAAWKHDIYSCEATKSAGVSNYHVRDDGERSYASVRNDLIKSLSAYTNNTLGLAEEGAAPATTTAAAELPFGELPPRDPSATQPATSALSGGVMPINSYTGDSMGSRGAMGSMESMGSMGVPGGFDVGANMNAGTGGFDVGAALAQMPVQQMGAPNSGFWGSMSQGVQQAGNYMGQYGQQAMQAAQGMYSSWGQGQSISPSFMSALGFQ